MKTLPPHGARMLGMRVSAPRLAEPKPLSPAEIGGLASLLRDLADRLERVDVHRPALIAEARITADLLIGGGPRSEARPTPGSLWELARQEHPNDHDAAQLRYVRLLREHGHIVPKDHPDAAPSLAESFGREGSRR